MIIIMIKNQRPCRRWNNPQKVKCGFILLKKRKEECRKYGHPAQLVPSSARLWLVSSTLPDKNIPVLWDSWANWQDPEVYSQNFIDDEVISVRVIAKPSACASWGGSGGFWDV